MSAKKLSHAALSGVVLTSRHKNIVAFRDTTTKKSGAGGRPPCFALPAPEGPPPQSVPANDGRRAHIDHRVAPFAESGEYCETYASCVIDPSGLDTPLEIPGELSAKDQILGTDRGSRAKEQNAEFQDIGEYADDSAHQVQYARIKPDSAPTCSAPHTRKSTTRIIVGHRCLQLPHSKIL
jgi:hypothetical protein